MFGLPAGKGKFDQFRIQSTGPLIVQETHYDPWGVELGGLGYQYGGIKVNPYLYNGKEANGHLGVNIYDYGARLYDPAIGRWFVVDPLAEIDQMRSPFTYALNNPLRYIDPDGMVADDYLAHLDKGNGNQREKNEAKSTEECERCAKLPEVVVTAERLDENSSNGIRINGYWGGGNNGMDPNESDYYGTTFSERASNSQFWLDLVLGEGAFASDPNVIHATVPDLPIGPGGALKAVKYAKDSRRLIQLVRGSDGVWKWAVNGRTASQVTLNTFGLTQPALSTTTKASQVSKALEKTITGVPNNTTPLSTWGKIKQWIAILGASNPL